MNFLRKIFPTKNDRFLKELRKIVKKVNALEPETEKLTSEEVKAKLAAIKSRLAQGESRKNVLPEVFALAREVARRRLNMRHFDVQIMGGIVLVDGKISEMATGEGKTLVATLAASLIALEGKGVHVVTVNDFLAQRDAEWMRPVYEDLDLSVGVVTAESSPEDRRAAYLCDITYVTNNELGFDYLRDNMRGLGELPSLRPLHFAIVDEVDSILIDEARTPLIISGLAEDKKHLCELSNSIVKVLKPSHYEIDEKSKGVTLAEEGVEFIEKHLKGQGIIQEGESLYSVEHASILHFITQSLKAYHLFARNKDYIIRNNRLMIVDEFTGRIMEGRRFSDNLHQVLEAKEGLPILRENQTLASVTYQNLFRKYKDLSGMSGTAVTESVEFFDIYKLECIGLPTNKKATRVDRQDLLYATFEEKLNAVVQKIEDCHKRKQPVLIGTVSVEKSEVFSQALRAKKIPHNVLNAKNHKKEAQIIASAGEPGAVTIATNMAGRGTDIKLGGNAEILDAKGEDTERFERQKQQVIEAGGLCVVGTERHESRRIDNQLRGRSGRQGDPGETVFFLCLEDDLMRIFAGDKLQFLMGRMKKQKGEPIEHAVITRSVEKAQMRVEAQNYEVRKHLLKFDDVINNQREMVYGLRREIIEGVDGVKDLLRADVGKVANNLCQAAFPTGEVSAEGVSALSAKVQRIVGEGVENKTFDTLAEYQKFLEDMFFEKLKLWFEAEDSFVNPQLAYLLLMIQDMKWRAHLGKVDSLKQGVNLRSYAQRSPIVEFKKEAYDLFLHMLEEVLLDSVAFLIHQKQPAERSAESSQEEAPAPSIEKRSDRSTVSRNDPCPCGSDKKYKHCHGKIS